MLYSFVGTAGAKTIDVRMTTASGSVSGGVAFWTPAATSSTTLSWAQYKNVFNTATNSQAFIFASNISESGPSNSAVGTGSQDTTVDQWLNFN